MQQIESLWTTIMDKLSKKPLVRFNERNLYLGYGENPEEVRLTPILFNRLMALCTKVTSSTCPEYKLGKPPKRFVVYQFGKEYINLNSKIFIRYVKYNHKGTILINDNCIPHLKGVTLPCRVGMVKLVSHLLCFGIYKLDEGCLINPHYHTIHSGSDFVTYINKDRQEKLCTYRQGAKKYCRAELNTHRVINLFQTLDQRETMDALCSKVDKKTPFWYVLKPLIDDLPKKHKSLHSSMLDLIPKVNKQDHRPKRQQEEKGLEHTFMNDVLPKIIAYEKEYEMWPIQDYPEYEHLYEASSLKIFARITENEKRLFAKRRAAKKRAAKKRAAKKTKRKPKCKA